MKKLIVTAHPSSLGFTHQIAERIKNLSEEKWDTVEILDLYKTDLQQAYLAFEDIKKLNDDPVRDAMQEKILWADEIVLVFPIWWGDMPAIMKNWMDCNFMSGFAFKYEKWKAIGLLKWKTARIITTSGASSFIYKVALHIQFMWNMNRIGFCGIKQKSFTVFGDMDSKKTDRTKYLEKIAALI